MTYYRWERELVDDITRITTASLRFNWDHRFIIRELAVGSSRPDLVLAYIRASALPARDLPQSPLECVQLTCEAEHKVDGLWKFVDASFIVAIEAKLTNWRRALSQARANQRYANQSWVALPSQSYSLVSDHLANFEECGVGLMIVAADDDFDFAVHPRQQCPRNWRRIFTLSRALASGDGAVRMQHEPEQHAEHSGISAPA